MKFRRRTALPALGAVLLLGATLTSCASPPVASTQLNICPSRVPATYYQDENTRLGYLQSVGPEPAAVSINELVEARLGTVPQNQNYVDAFDSGFLKSGQKKQVCDDWPGPFIMRPGHYAITGKTQSCEFINPKYNPCVVTTDVTVYGEFDLKPF
jgi:hypothetical protein